MCEKGQRLRVLVNERLTAAAQEIFALFERTIAEYEEELCRSKEENKRKQQLLDSVLSPQVLLHRTAVPPETESQEESYDIKEEPEELSIKQEEDRPPAECQYIPVIVKNENEEAKSSLLQQKQTEEDREETDNDNEDWTQELEPPADASTPQMETETDEKDSEKSGASKNSSLFSKYMSKQTGTNKSSQERCAIIIKKDLFLSELGDKLKRHNCPICGKTFKRDLWSHMLVHTGERPFSCSVCKKGFTRKSSLRLHMALHMREKPFNCPVCKKGFTQKAHLKVHMATHTKTVEKFLQLQQKQTDETKGAHLDFNLDPFGFLNSEIDQNLNPQAGSSTQQTEIEADAEEAYSKDSDQSGASQNSSPNTTKSRSRRRSPNNSSPESTGQGKGYDCWVCGKTFRGGLWKHMLIHTGERPFSCSVCKKGFTRKSSLRAHMPLHTGERPYSCTICEKTFTQKVHLKTHLATHTEAIEKFLQLQRDQEQTEENRDETEADDCGGAEIDIVIEPQGDSQSDKSSAQQMETDHDENLQSHKKKVNKSGSS